MKVLKRVPYRMVSDLESATEFYVRILGFEVREELFHKDGERFWISLSNGECHVMLSTLLVHNRAELTWLYVEDVDAAYQEIIAAAGRPESAPRVEPHGCKEFVICDPSGHPCVISQNLG